MPDPREIERLAEHPSAYIAEEMETRGWSRADVANRMGVECCARNLFALDLYLEAGPSFPSLRLGQDTADRLARAFDVSPDLFLNLEAAWLSARLRAADEGGT